MGDDGFNAFIICTPITGFLSHLRVKLRDWAVRPVRAGCYSWAALSYFFFPRPEYAIDSNTLYSLKQQLVVTFLVKYFL